MILAHLMSGVLLLIALLHVLWGLGIVWPLRDESAFVDAVVGFRQADRMPSTMACMAVAVVLSCAAAVAQLLTGPGVLVPSPVSTLLGIALSAVFLIRGVITYAPLWRSITPRQPFARLDATLYGPLCLCLGTGFAMLMAMSDG